MKKKLLYALILTNFVGSFAQTPQTISASAYIQEIGSDEVTTSQGLLSTAVSQQENVTVFASLEEFLDNCADSEFLTFEDFAGNQAETSIGLAGCDVSLLNSLDGGSCFPAGEIQENVDFTNDQNGQMLYVDGTTFGQVNPGVGADILQHATVINFTSETAVTSVAFNLSAPLVEGPTEISILGENGIIDTISIGFLAQAFTFIGFIADEPVTSIIMENTQGSGGLEVVSQFYFGSCEVLSVSDINSIDLSIYPNPAQDILRIESKQMVETISIFNLLGQRVAVQTANSFNSSIDVQDLTSGAYIVEIVTNNQKSTYKLIKE
jgi:hypothetical protein